MGTVRKRADGAYVVGPPPDGRTVEEHLAELTGAFNAKRFDLMTSVTGLRHCDGCDEDTTGVLDFVVTHHDGTKSDAAYCGDCADLARADYNGETKFIEPREHSEFSRAHIALSREVRR